MTGRNGGRLPCLTAAQRAEILRRVEAAREMRRLAKLTTGARTIAGRGLKWHGESYDDIADHFGVSRCYVQTLVTGHVYLRVNPLDNAKQQAAR